MRAVLVASMATGCLTGCSLFFGDDRIADDGAGGASSASSSTQTGDGATSSSTAPSSGGGSGDGGGSAEGGAGGVTQTGGAGGDGDGGAGAGGGGEGGEGPRCGKTSVLADGFELGRRSERLWHRENAGGDKGADIFFEGGAAALRKIAPDVATNPSLVSNHLYSIVDDAVAVHLVQPLGVTSGDGTASALLLRSVQLTVGFELRDGTLRALSGARDQLQTVDSRPYVPAADAYWRVRHQDDRLVLETAPDGVAYVHFADVPQGDLGDLSLVGVTIEASAAASVAPPAELRIDDVRGLDDGAVACAASSFGDTFSSPVTSPQWSVSETRCDLAESDLEDRLDVHMLATDLSPRPPPPAPYCTYATTRLYDLREDAVLVAIPIPPPNDQSMGMGIDFFDLGFNGASIAIVMGQLHANKIYPDPRDPADVPGLLATSLVTLPDLDPADLQWLRIRCSGGDTLFESSQDGVTWTTRWTEPTWFEPAAIQIRLFVGTNQTTTTDADVAFDSYNSPP